MNKSSTNGFNKFEKKVKEISEGTDEHDEVYQLIYNDNSNFIHELKENRYAFGDAIASLSREKRHDGTEGYFGVTPEDIAKVQPFFKYRPRVTTLLSQIETALKTKNLPKPSGGKLSELIKLLQLYLVTITTLEVGSTTDKLTPVRMRGNLCGYKNQRIKDPPYIELDYAARRLIIGADTFPLTEGKRIWELLSTLIGRNSSGRMTPAVENGKNWKTAVDMLRRKIGKENLKHIVVSVGGGYRLGQLIKVTGTGQVGIRPTRQLPNR